MVDVGILRTLSAGVDIDSMLTSDLMLPGLIFCSEIGLDRPLEAFWAVLVRIHVLTARQGRQRKLRCILPDDDHTQPCTNCAARGRHCVLQTEAGRNRETSNVTSRDRIRQLETSVGKLWSIVRDLRTELGHTDDQKPPQDYNTVSYDDEQNGMSDTEGSESSPMNPPAHLQQLFDNEMLEHAQGSVIASPESSSDKSSSALLTKARKRLQEIVPSKEDVQAVAPLTQTWFNVYNSIFPPFTMFKTVHEILMQYDGLHTTDASPYTIAALLLWMGIAVQNAPPDMLRNRSNSINDGPRFVQKVSKAVEEVIVTNDTLAGSVEGIEISLLWVRLQLVGSNTKRVWLMLRRCIALAELIGLPKAVYASQSTQITASKFYASSQEAAAGVWESICVVDRIAGLMFNLPLGTAAYGLSIDQPVMSPEGNVNVKSYINHIASIAAAIQGIDDTYLSQRGDLELFDKVSKVDQDLRALKAMTPESWWVIGPQHGVPEHLMQYWQYYLWTRTHLQLALRDNNDPQCAYSYLTCTQACREIAVRYGKLRSILPLNFFAGRIIDLEAMTAAVFLVYISHRPSANQVVLPNDGGVTSRELAYQIVEMMESVYTRTPNQIGCDVARKASKAIRHLDELLSQEAPVESQTLLLQIPLLGKVNVSRHPKRYEQSLSSDFSSGRQYSGSVSTLPQTPVMGDPNAAYNMSDPFAWSMDLNMEEFPPFADDFFGADQWFSFANGQPS